jgi:hypothetical protein
MRAVIAAVLVTVGLAVPAVAQTSPSYGEHDDGWRFDVGGFRIGADTRLRLQGPEGGEEIDFEEVLRVPVRGRASGSSSASGWAENTSSPSTTPGHRAGAMSSP